MKRNHKLLAVFLAVIMAFTITGQVSVFAADEESEQTVQTEQEVIQDSSSEETEETSEEPQEEEEEQELGAMSAYTVADTMGTVVTASGLKKLSSPPTNKDWDGKTIDISWYDPDKNNFSINTGAQLAGLAALVNGSYDKTITQYYGTPEQLAMIQCVKIDNFMFVGAGGGNTGGTCYKSLGKHDFMGKTIKVTAKIDMTAGNYMPIGGKYPMCDAKGSLIVNNEAGTGDAHVIEAYFNGVIDFGGHEIKIKCDRYTKSGFAYSMAIGLVGYIGEVIDEDEVEEYGSQFKEQSMQSGWAPAVRNVSLQGSVNGRRMVGGIVGRVGDSDYSDLGVYVENCANHADVSSTDAKGVGGVVGSGWGAGHIINCYNTGNIEGTYSSCPVGGICASNEGMDIYNCYNTGKMSGNTYGRGLGGHDGGSYTIDNSYTLKDCNSDSKNSEWYSGTATNISVNADTFEADQMKSESFAALLNGGDDYYSCDVFVYDAAKNNGYPVLYFEAGSAPKDSCKVTIGSVDNGKVTAYYNGVELKSGDSVPYGAVIVLTATPATSEYILSTFKAGAASAKENLLADFCTVTEDVTLGAEIIKLKEGTIKIGASTDCDVSVTKKGIVKKDGEVSSVKKQKVISGNAIYQLDVLDVSAVLHKEAYPDNVNKEYSGEFEYTFKYVKDGVTVGKEITNKTGRISIDKSIDGAELVVTAEPLTQNKTWLSFADTSWYYDCAPDEDYIIDSAEDLAGLAYLVNVEANTFKGETITIPEETVISLKNTDGRGGTLLWPGIGLNSSTGSFQGTVEGNGCTILDMSRIDEEGSNGALFNYCNGATIRGIAVRGETRVQSIGAGLVSYADGCLIEDCINYVKVTNVKNENDTYGSRAGGIAAQAVGTTFNRCINRASISGYSSVGGIAGHCHQTACSVNECSNYGEIKSSCYGETAGSYGSDGIGGITGRTYGDINLCANFGDVLSADKCTGGIAGCVEKKSTTAGFNIKNSFNQGNVEAESTATNAGAGGLIGYCTSVVLSNCYSTGKVTGALTGGYLRSGVGYFHCGSGTKATNNYVLSGIKAYGYNPDVTPDYITIDAMSADYMKSSGLVTKLGSAYVAKSGDYPTFSRFTASNSIERTCTVTFEGAEELNGKSFKINYGGSVPLITSDSWCRFVYTLNGEPWDGKNITSDVTVNVVKKEDVQFNAIFKADGKIVATVAYGADTDYDSIKPDASLIESRDGYAATWPVNITLNDKEDTVINAVYYPSEAALKNVQDGISLGDGIWYIGGKSTGTITINEGSNVTLIGDSGLCSELNVVMEKNSTLVAQNLQMSCDTKPVLTMNQGCTLTLKGSGNYIEGVDTDSKDCVPAVNILGDAVIDGSGTLSATSETGDTVIDIADGKKLTFKSGTLKLHKSSKIGAFDGGLINSGRDTASGTGTFEMTGGTLYCAANSDNMHAIKVGTFKMTAGDALVVSNDEDKALVAKSMNITGGNLKVTAADYSKNETDKSAKNRKYYYNADAIDCTSFTSTHELHKELSSGITKPYAVTAGTKTFECTGLTRDYNIDDDAFVRSVDPYLYIWSDKNSTVSVIPAGADMSLADNKRGYTVSESGNVVNMTLTGTVACSQQWYKVCATYDSGGNMLECKFKQIKKTSGFEMTTIGNGAASYKLFVVEDLTTMIPGLESYEKTLN